jgi:hypothetical protein
VKRCNHAHCPARGRRRCIDAAALCMPSFVFGEARRDEIFEKRGEVLRESE